jgi:hypothetical protein
MGKLIIFPNDDGGIDILVPTESVEGAMKDIPSGKPYLIVDATDIPATREFRNAWVADFTGAEVKA